MGERVSAADQEIPAPDARDGRPAPQLSVVIPSLRGYRAIRTTVGHLEAQSWHDRLELVIVTPSARALGLEEATLSWCRHLRVVEVGEMTSLGGAYAAGVREARSPVVVLAEDHSLPEPGWARALIERHREPWAAVGPVVELANPGSPFGEATYYMGYGRWAGLTAPGEIVDLPGHNSAYKRAVLLEYGPELDVLLEVASILHWDLRAKGHRLCLEPAARTRHYQATTLSFLVQEAYLLGRLFAAARARRWSPLQRAAYTAAAAVIPAVRLRRIVAQICRTGSGRKIPRLFPALLVGLVASAAGELVGYAQGAGGTSSSRLFDLESNRNLHSGEASVPRSARQ